MTDYEFACEQVDLLREALRDAILAASTTDGRGTHERQDVSKLRKLLSLAMNERDALSPSPGRKSGRSEYYASFK